jgi:stress-induced morphogen
MEEQLRVAAEGSEVNKCDRVQGHHEGKKCLVLGDSVIWNVGTERRNMVVECFQGIRTVQMHRVVENRDLRHPTPKIIIKKKYSRNI